MWRRRFHFADVAVAAIIFFFTNYHLAGSTSLAGSQRDRAGKHRLSIRRGSRSSPAGRSRALNCKLCELAE